MAAEAKMRLWTVIMVEALRCPSAFCYIRLLRTYAVHTDASRVC